MSRIGQYIEKVKKMEDETKRRKVQKVFEEMVKIYGPEFIQHAERWTETEGIGLYSLAGLMNHSCRHHNVICRFVSDHQMFVFAARDVPRGSQLFHSYLPPSLECARKHSFLRIKFNFLCQECR